MSRKEVIDDRYNPWKPSIIYDRFKWAAREQSTRYIDYHVDTTVRAVVTVKSRQDLAASQEYREFYGGPVENKKDSVGYQNILERVQARTNEGVLSEIDQQAYDRWLTQPLPIPRK